MFAFAKYYTQTLKRCHGHLHYDRKFQIFIFLIGYINVNIGVFCLIISYLRIKSYNVLNYNNCSTDWSFPLSNTVSSNPANDEMYMYFITYCDKVCQWLATGQRVSLARGTLVSPPIKLDHHDITNNCSTDWSFPLSNTGFSTYYMDLTTQL
jgi:hypothetical protein